MNKKKTLIVCALEQETEGQLEDYDVIYTGVGKINATYHLHSKIGEIYNSYQELPKLESIMEQQEVKNFQLES